MRPPDGCLARELTRRFQTTGRRCKSEVPHRPPDRHTQRPGWHGVIALMRHRVTLPTKARAISPRGKLAVAGSVQAEVGGPRGSKGQRAAWCAVRHALPGARQRRSAVARAMPAPGAPRFCFGASPGASSGALGFPSALFPCSSREQYQPLCVIFLANSVRVCPRTCLSIFVFCLVFRLIAL